MELLIGTKEAAALARDGIRPEDVRAVFSAGWRTGSVVRDEAAGVSATGGRIGNITLWVVFWEEPGRCVLRDAYYHRLQVEGV